MKQKTGPTQGTSRQNQRDHMKTSEDINEDEGQMINISDKEENSETDEQDRE